MRDRAAVLPHTAAVQEVACVQLHPRLRGVDAEAPACRGRLHHRRQGQLPRRMVEAEVVIRRGPVTRPPNRNPDGPAKKHMAEQLLGELLDLFGDRMVGGPPGLIVWC